LCIASASATTFISGATRSGWRPSKWGNPFVVGEHGARGECIALYENCLRQNDALIAALDELRGLVLGCWCAPRACHGDLLLRLANATLAQRERWLALAA